METRIDARGYELLKGVDRIGRTIHYHVLIAESFFGGLLPNGNEVHHLDEDKLNNESWNLMVCSPEQHRITHRRLRALKACGNPDWLKCHVCGEYDDPNNLYISKCRQAIRHRKCFADYQRERLKA